ncbi:hypothetical protein TSUD_358030, partial [Trifolium subterraneum]
FEIVREEAKGDREKQSRLLDPYDISYVLKNNKGSEAIRSLAIDVSTIKELQLHPKVFAKMNKLRYLDIYSNGYSYDFLRSRGGLNLSQGLEYLPNELRYLRWARFPLESLPCSFSGENLVVLDLQYSRVRKLWHDDHKEDKRRVAFWNCLKLDQHSLKAIGLNAQINIKKFARQHISISRDHDDYDAQGTYVYPGSSVPEWLVYRTTHDYMTIDLSFMNHSSQLGFIFCFIVPPVPSQGSILRFNISVDEGDDSQLHLDRTSREIKSDHVYLVSDRGFSRYLNSRVKVQPRGTTSSNLFQSISSTLAASTSMVSFVAKP